VTLAAAGPMLARSVAELPVDGFLYEPKWDGFRCLAARARDDVDLRSRHGRPFARYFPEVVDALRSVDVDRLVLDGELLAAAGGEFSFPALLARLHPAASRVARLRNETPAVLVAFDVLMIDDQDLTGRPFVERRAALERVLDLPPAGLSLGPITNDVSIARSWLERGGPSIDGVVAKPRDLPYEPGRRSMLKVKRVRTADCVVAGFRWLNERRELGSLLLGVFDDDGQLWHVGVVSSFTEQARVRFRTELEPLAVPLAEHPWAGGFKIERSPLGRLKGAAGRWTPDMAMDWVPLRLERVCEVGYDRFDGDRLRHPARFIRWRPDRDPRSCTFDQLRTDGVAP
jgi:ATP-dependent DNA ligase